MTTTNLISESRARRVIDVCATALFFVTLAVYWLTTEPTASFWDCPEYITTAAMLEIGHPPGNPTWSLAARAFATLAPSPELTPFFVNLTSGLFTALAAFFLALIIPAFAKPLIAPRSEGVTPRQLIAILTAQIVGTLAFAWCDTAWFSAVEAEVYAFSIFCTSVCIWIALRWAHGHEHGNPHTSKWIILFFFVTGLSIGVHQLNLLCIPAAALIFLFTGDRRRVGALRYLLTLLASILIIACILFGMMPGMIKIAELAEIIATDAFLAPFNLGVVVYAILAIFLTVAAAIYVCRGTSRYVMATLIFTALSLSGIFAFGGRVILGVIFSLVAAVVFLIWLPELRPIYVTGLWSVAFLMLGYSTYGVILIRANANPPMNQGDPSTIFAFESYLGRDQYGSNPLLYGRTPQSQILRTEQISVNAAGDTVADYSGFAKIKRDPQVFRADPFAKVLNKNGLLTHKDSVFNRKAESSAGHHYVVTDYKVEYRYPPELDMFFPRITSSKPAHLESYQSWGGMTDSTMVAVKASEAVDSLGKAVGKYYPEKHERIKRDAKRPSYIHNGRVLVSYQLTYMYFRYLLWNFSGRQNYIPSQGQVDAGNFITGFDAADALMIGDQTSLPDEYGPDSKGHNVYYFIPFIMAVCGIILQLRRSRAGERQLAVVGWLFLMTGIAIVIYLNQTPNEPRERDYSFIGSFFAFAIWIGLGAGAIVNSLVSRYLHKHPIWLTYALAALLVIAVPGWMLAQNWDDHDRSHRTVTSDMARNTLEPLDPGAIIFVNGDNYTFPLWYAQEVEGVRRDVRVINLAYLGTGWLPLQLKLQAHDSKPVPMTASHADLAYNYLTYARIPADTVTLEARKAFTAMYGNARNGDFSFPSGRIRIPSSGTDSITINLRDVSGGKSVMYLREIMLLDIIATNACSEHPRPIYWSSALGDSNMAGFARYSAYDGMAMRLTDSIANGVTLNASRLAQHILHTYRFGGVDQPGVWLDEPGREQVRMTRRAIRRAANGLIAKGDHRTALALIRLQLTKLPISTAPWNIYYDQYVTINEGVETANILLSCSEALKMPELRRQALDILRDEALRLAHWRLYYNRLSKRLQGVTSPDVTLATSNLYAPIDAYTRAGGDTTELFKNPLLEYIDLPGEKERWTRYHTTRLLLHDARYASPDSVTAAHLHTFLKAGGKMPDLYRFSELATFPFDKYTDTATPESRKK